MADDDGSKEESEKKTVVVIKEAAEDVHATQGLNSIDQLKTLLNVLLRFLLSFTGCPTYVCM